MPPPHVLAQGARHHDLEHEIKPRQVEQANSVEHDRPRVERQYIGPLHQRQRARPEAVAELAGDSLGRPVAPPQLRHQPLEPRRARLLPGGIADVAFQEKLPKHVPAPRRLVVNPPLLGGVVQLAPRLAFQEEEVDLPVIIRQAALPAVASETGVEHNAEKHRRGEQGVRRGIGDAEPTELQPVMRVKTIDQPQVDGDEPYLAGGAVEDAPEARLLPRHAGELPVGAVVEIRPCQQQDGDQVVPQAAPALRTVRAVGEEKRRRRADNHRQDGHRIGMHAQAPEQQRPGVADGPRPYAIEPFLGVVGLIRRFDFLFHTIILFANISLATPGNTPARQASIGPPGR